MKLDNEFTVAADVDRVWTTLLDIESVAGCLPGATIEPSDDDGTYSGAMKLKIGPMTVTYKGSAVFTEVDEQDRRAVIALRAREAKGQGTAMATITNVLEPLEGGTRVRAETDLQVTGAQARFGRGVMEDVAERVLAEFSARLERQLAGGEPQDAVDGAGTAEPSPVADTAKPSPVANTAEPADAPDVLDMGAVLWSTRGGRALAIGAACLAVAIAVAIVILLLGS